MGSTLAGILSNLASSAAEGAIASITPERNRDLERAGAAAIRQGLQFGRESSKGGAKRVLTGDLERWFDAWDQRLARGLREAPEALFRSADSPDPVDWVQADKDTWWAAFEQVLLRWAAEEQFEEACRKEAALPVVLRDLLREELQGWVGSAFHHVLRNEDQRRAWIGYQQRYFEQLAQQAAQGNTAIAQLAQGVEELRTFLQVREPELPLVPASRSVRKAPAVPMRREIELLSAYRRAVPMLGRKEQLQEWLDWVMETEDVSVPVMVGRAGAGKTRFAVELLLEVERLGQGWWHAGFLPASALKDAKGALWSRPTLVVIDYAAVSAESIRRWLEEVTDHVENPGHPLRVLLLERAAKGWWAELRGHTDKTWYTRMFQEQEPEFVKPLSDAGWDRNELLALTMSQGARLREVAMPTIPSGEPEFRRRLAGEIFADPLCVQMAALTALDRERFPRMVDVLSLRRTDLAFEVAARERLCMERFCSLSKDAG